MSKNAKGEEIPQVGAVSANDTEATIDIGAETIVFKTSEIKFKRPNKTMILLDFEKTMGFRPKRIYLKIGESRNNSAVVVGIIDDDRESAYAKDLDAKKPK